MGTLWSAIFTLIVVMALGAIAMSTPIFHISQALSGH